MIRPPSSRPTLFYRLLRALFSVGARALFSVRISGMENLPRDGRGRVAGAWICAAVPHRNWSEGVLLMVALPADLRIVTVADGPTVTRSWWRRRVAALMGGVVAVDRQPRPAMFTRHLEAAARVIRAGAVLAIAPETGGPTRPPRLRRLSPGVAHFARHCGASVIPVVFGGTHLLFLRRRIEVRILPPLAPPTREADRAAIAAWMSAFRALVEDGASAAHAAAESASPTRRRWTWLTGRYPRVD